MGVFQQGQIALNYQLTGPSDGPVVVFANSLGTDLHLWDDVLPLLPQGLQILRMDKRGHGASDCPPPPYSMGTLVSDAEGLMDHLGLSDSLFVGLSIGGLIAQGLATKRPDLIRAMVLSNTGAKIGNRDIWQDRCDAIAQHGMAAASTGIINRWFSKEFQTTPAADHWRQHLCDVNPDGYIGCAMAIAGADFITPTSGLRIPTLGIAGGDDKATPPDMVRELADLIPGSQLHIIRKSGHLPCVDNPTEYASVLTGFINAIGHN